MKRIEKMQQENRNLIEMEIQAPVLCMMPKVPTVPPTPQIQLFQRYSSILLSSQNKKSYPIGILNTIGFQVIITLK